MTNKEALEKNAQDLQRRINDRIKEESKNWHFLEYRARAEMVVEELLGLDSPWEWDLFEVVAGVPQFAILRYDPRKDRP